MWRKGALMHCWECECSYCGKQYRGSSEKLKIRLPSDPANPLLDMYLNKTKNINSVGSMHTSVHSSIIYNCQDKEAPKYLSKDE